MRKFSKYHPKATRFAATKFLEGPLLGRYIFQNIATATNKFYA